MPTETQPKTQPELPADYQEMGRRKIAIEPLKNDRNRTVTFTKRKAGLFKKAHELAVLCEVDISVIIIGRNHKIYQYSSNRTEDVLERYRANPSNVYESKTPKDYGDYELKSRILSDVAMSSGSSRHRHTSSANSITTSSLDHLQKGDPRAYHHLRSRSDMVNSSSYPSNGGSVDYTGDYDGEGEEDEEDEEEDEEEDVNENENSDSDNRHEIVHETENHGFEQEGRAAGKKRTARRMKVSNPSFDGYGDYEHKAAQDHTQEYPAAKKIKVERKEEDIADIPKVSIPYIYASPMDPKTPEMDLHQGQGQGQNAYMAHSSANVTPYHSSSALKRSKLKDNSSGSNMKRPTLSLTIPTVDNRQLSDASTITAAESSNKSNLTSLSNSKDTGSGKNSTYTKNNENVDNGNHKNGGQMLPQKKQDPSGGGDNGGARESGKPAGAEVASRGKTGAGNDNMNITLPSPTFNLTYTTNSSNGSNPKNRQPTANNYSNSTPLPSALFKDRKALYTPTTSTFFNNLSMMNASNPGETPVTQMGYFNFNNMSPTQLLVPPFPLPPLATGGSSGNVPIETQQNIKNTPVAGESPGELRRSSGNLDKVSNMNNMNMNTMNMNTMNINTMNTMNNMNTMNTMNGMSSGTAEAGQKTRMTPSQLQSAQAQTPHQPFLPPMNSATSAYFPQMRMPANQRHPAHPTINTNISTSELPTLSAELSALPSRYVDFQSPSTIFTHDWQLPTGTTPIVAGPPHPLPLVNSGNTGAGGPQTVSSSGAEPDMKLKTESAGPVSGSSKGGKHLSTVSK